MTAPATRFLTGAALVASALAAPIAGCTCAPGGVAPAPSASVASASAAPEVTAPTRRSEDEARPVYPIDGGAPDPAATRFCEAVVGLPDQRKAACCPGASTGFALTSQCVRTLSYALGQQAIAIAPADLDRCVEAMKKATDGCDWVTPYSTVIPPACEGILKGKLTESAPCRSSLECAGELRCRGLAATQLGTCGPPRATRIQCGTSVDTLATFTRQDRVDRDHPECTGYCVRGRCEDAAAAGGACKSDPQCGKGVCVNGTCASAPLPGAGEPCPAGRCAEGAGCVKGTCAPPKAEDAACELRAECRGECVSADGGTTGTCAKHCPLFLVPVRTATPTPSLPKRR